jgi:hypothetical protein
LSAHGDDIQDAIVVARIVFAYNLLGTPFLLGISIWDSYSVTLFGASNSTALLFGDEFYEYI